MGDAKDEEAARTYLRNLTHLVHFRVINLGETVLPFSEYKISLDHLGRKGLNFDLGGKTPLGRKDKDRADKNKGYELIQSVQGMMDYLRNKEDKMEHRDKLLPFILERTCYIHGDQELHDSYRAAQEQFWSCQDAAGKHDYQKRMMKTLLKGMTELDYNSQTRVVEKGREQAGNLRLVGPKLHPDDAGRLYDVKQEIYRLPDRLLYSLAMYYDIRPQSAWDAVDQLLASNRISEEAARHLKYMASFAAMLRLETYLHHGQQNEQLSLRGSLAQGGSGEESSQAMHELLMLPLAALKEGGSLFRYYYTALPLHQQMEEFFELLHLRQQMRGKPVLERVLEEIFGAKGKYAAPQEGAYFQAEPFYDTSCAVKVSVYNRLQQYEAAKECAAKHHKEVKERYFYNHAKLARYHHNLAVTCYHLGEFEDSFDHFKCSLELAKGVYPEHHPEIAKVLRSQGIAYYTRKNFEQSRQCFAESLQQLQAFYSDNHPETAQMLLSLGEVDEAMGNYEASLKHKADALEMLQSLYPEHHPAKAHALLSLGDAYAAMGQLKASREHKQDALKMFKDFCGKSHPEVARALLSLGDADAALGNFSSSEQHKKEALSMFRDLYGSSHPEVARTLLSLGEMYALNGKLEESLKHKEDSWKMFQAFYRADHPEVVWALSSLNETRGRRIQGEGSTRQDTGHALRPVRTVYPQHLTLLSTPRHGKEPKGENTLLRNYYQHKNFACVPSLFEEKDSKHVKDLECQLMLREHKRVPVKEDKEQAGSSSKEDQGQARLEEVKTPIRLADLFKDRSVRPEKPVQAVQRILLTGDPGTGKTTVSKNLAYQWAVGEWGQEFDAVYLLPARNLQQDRYNEDNYRKLNTLATAIVNNCFNSPSKEEAYNRLRDHIEQELEKPTTLVILDGLDEQAGASEDILRQAQDQTVGYKLLMLSRPYGIEEARRLVDIEIEHAGLNPAQLERYVRKEVLGEQADELIGYIRKHTNVRSIAHVPVNIQILCALWQDEGCGAGKEELQQGSLTGLYGSFTGYIWKRYVNERKLPHSKDNKVALFNALGQIALRALEKGTPLINFKLVDDVLERAALDGDLKARLREAGFLLLKSVDRAAYEFPHLMFQEYFAGRTLAGQFLAKDPRERERVSDFLSKHKYEGQYARILSFMAGEVSKIEGVKGIKKLLSLLGKSEKEIVGVQHLLLQLRVIHEWLCVATEREADKGMTELEDKFQVRFSLEKWFSRAFAHVRLEGYETDSTGYKLLELFSRSLQTFPSVFNHNLYNSKLFLLLKKAIQGPNNLVQGAAFSSLVQAMATVPSESGAILETPQQADKDPQKYIRLAAIESLGQAMAVTPDKSRVILETLRKTTAKDQRVDFRRAAISALGQAMAAASSESREDILKILLQATQSKDEDRPVRRAAILALGQAMAAVPGESRANILKILLQAAQNEEDSRVRYTAFESLGQAMAAVPGESRANILKILLQAAQNTDEDQPVREAAISALGKAMAAAPDDAKNIFHILDKILVKAVKNESYNVLTAVLKSLEQAKAMGATPQEVRAKIELLLRVLKGKDDDIHKDARAFLEQTVVKADPDKAQIMIKTLLPAVKNPDGYVREVAVSALLKVSLKELLAHYWSTSDAKLIPYITPRLYHTPLVVEKSARKGYQQVLLYAAAGQPSKWERPQEVLADFECRVKHEVDQLSHVDSNLSARIDKSVWKHYFGDVGEEEPALPADIEQILDSPCPFWEGYQVRDTHLLVLIPERVASKRLTLDYLGKLIKSPQKGHGTNYRLFARDVSNAVGGKGSGSSYWVLMTRGVLTGSREQNYKNQCELVERYSGYTVPSGLEAAVVMLLHHVRSGERLYGDNIWIRCRDKFTRDKLTLIVGGFSATGLTINRIPYVSNCQCGVAVLRNFKELATLSSLGDTVVGKAVWEQYFGEVGNEPPLPVGIEEIMDSRCPFWESKQVKDTHLLVLIPKHVSGQPLTLDYLRKLIKSPQGRGHATEYSYYDDAVLDSIGSQSSDSSYWVLMTRDVLPRSRNKSYNDQLELVGSHEGLGYELPRALEAAVVMLLHHVRSGEHLYADVQTRCRGNDSDDFPLVVGGFSSKGLEVSCSYYGNDDDYGVAALQNFGQAVDYLCRGPRDAAGSPRGGGPDEVAAASSDMGDNHYHQGRLEKAIQNYKHALAVPAVSQAKKASIGHNLGCTYHLASLAVRQEGDEQQAQAYLEKATTSFEQAVQASGRVKAGLYTEYGNFLLDTGKAAQAHDYLRQAIASGDGASVLGYGLQEKQTVTPALRAYIDQQQEVSLRGIDYAYYLMIHHYEDFQEAGIAMAQTRDAYLAAYKESLDQRSGRPGQEKKDKTAYHLLGSLYQAQGDQEAAAAAFARAQDGTEHEATQAAA